MYIYYSMQVIDAKKIQDVLITPGEIVKEELVMHKFLFFNIKRKKRSKIKCWKLIINYFDSNDKFHNQEWTCENEVKIRKDFDSIVKQIKMYDPNNLDAAFESAILTP